MIGDETVELVYLLPSLVQPNELMYYSASHSLVRITASL